MTPNRLMLIGILIVLASVWAGSFIYSFLPASDWRVFPVSVTFLVTACCGAACMLVGFIGEKL
jgi:hypothetical protein